MLAALDGEELTALPSLARPSAGSPPRAKHTRPTEPSTATINLKHTRAGPGMPLQNITVDDFDSQVIYSRQEDWQTPNPQDNPAAFQTANYDQWHEATHHRTSVVGTTASLNFTGQ